MCREIEMGTKGGRMMGVLKIIGVVIVVALAGFGVYVIWNLKDWEQTKRLNNFD